MMNNSVHVLERLSALAPLGIRFWDAVSHALIADDGLRVTAYPLSNPLRRVQGFPNRCGTYVLQNLPGMRDIEQGAGDEEFWANLPPKRPFVVEVVDADLRFQPFLLTVDLPVRGLLTLECVLGSPPDAGLPAIPLYSAPARSVPGAMAVLRTTLAVSQAPLHPQDPPIAIPAAWVMLEVHVAGHPPVRGFADAEGRVALIFPYPEPLDFADDPESPVSLAAGPPLTGQTWIVQLRAMYTPLNPVPAVPDLCTILTQASARLWQDSAQTQQLTEVQLKFGQELVVRSYDTATGKPLANLFITPAV
jgi:hypothetical protein